MSVLGGGVLQSQGLLTLLLEETQILWPPETPVLWPPDVKN